MGMMLVRRRTNKAEKPVEKVEKVEAEEKAVRPKKKNK